MIETVAVAGWRQSTKVSFCSPRCTSHYTTLHSCHGDAHIHDCCWQNGPSQDAEASTHQIGDTLWPCFHLQGVWAITANALHFFQLIKRWFTCSLTCCYDAYVWRGGGRTEALLECHLASLAGLGRGFLIGLWKGEGRNGGRIESEIVLLYEGVCVEVGGGLLQQKYFVA